MKEITLFGKKAEVPEELWKKYIGTGNFTDEDDGMFDIQTYLGNDEGNLSKRAEEALRQMIPSFLPRTRRQMKEAIKKLEEEGLL